jgi:hypothetical protein
MLASGMMDPSQTTQMSGSATSTTKSSPGTLKAFASLRFRGDRLEPDRLTEILGNTPTLAYRKGEAFKRSRGQEARGRTGLWMLSTEKHISSIELDEHLRYLLAMLFPADTRGRLDRLRELMREQQIAADVSCFWYGEAGAEAPVIAEDVRSALARLPAEIETDFHSG